MRNLTKIIGSVLLIGSMAFSVAGCTGFKAITAKEFKSAIKAATDLKSSEIPIEKDGKIGSTEVNATLKATEGQCRFGFIEFEDTEDATDYFEDNIYDSFIDMIEDEGFEGNYRETYSESAATGYILVDGEGETTDFFKGEIYGGIFLKDNTIVIAVTTSGKTKEKDKIDKVFDEINYPKP